MVGHHCGGGNERERERERNIERDRRSKEDGGDADFPATACRRQWYYSRLVFSGLHSKVVGFKSKLQII
ncbi:hypothetical protein Hanom_Chr16g01474101 [Helianthus anomalus]